MKLFSVRKTRAIFALLCAGWIFSVSGVAAVRSVPGDDERAVPSLSIKGYEAGKILFKNGGAIWGKGSTRHLAFEIAQPLGGGEALNFGANLNYEHSDVTPAPLAQLPLPKNFDSLGLGLSAEWQAAPTWQVMSLVSSTWSYANPDHVGSRLSTNGFSLGLAGLANHSFSEVFSMTIGIAYNSKGEGISRISPIVSFAWNWNEVWSATLGFPVTALHYRVSSKWTASVVLEGDGSSYFVESDPLPGAVGKPSLARSRLEFYSVRAGLELTYELKPGSNVRLGYGSMLAQEFDYRSRNFKLRSDSTAAYGSVALLYAF